MNQVSRVLSLDIPWGKSNVVGAAYYDVSSQNIKVSAVSGRSLPILGDISALEESIAEVSNFIAYGASKDCVRTEDSMGPFGNFPSCVNSRREYLSFLYNAFLQLRTQLELNETQIDLINIDLPLVTKEILDSIDFRSCSTFRPVERAFASKIMIPGASRTRNDGRIQFARFQPGIHNGCRPGQSVFEMALHVFQGSSAIESFPQLFLGTLAEFNQENGCLIQRLAAHKSGNQNGIVDGQRVLNEQLSNYLKGIPLKWIGELTPKEKGDAYDAVLGLLPGIEITRDIKCRMRLPVLLRNIMNGELANPVATGSGLPAVGCRAWIADSPELKKGVNREGILALDVNLWG